MPHPKYVECLRCTWAIDLDFLPIVTGVIVALCSLCLAQGKRIDDPAIPDLCPPSFSSPTTPTSTPGALTAPEPGRPHRGPQLDGKKGKRFRKASFS